MPTIELRQPYNRDNLAWPNAHLLSDVEKDALAIALNGIDNLDSRADDPDVFAIMTQAFAKRFHEIGVDPSVYTALQMWFSCVQIIRDRLAQAPAKAA